MSIVSSLAYELGVSTSVWLAERHKEGNLVPFDLEGHVEGVAVALDLVEGFEDNPTLEQSKFIEGFYSECENQNVLPSALFEVFKEMAIEDYVPQKVVVKMQDKIELEESVLNPIEEVLSIEEGCSEDYGSDEVIHVEVFEFLNPYKSIEQVEGWYVDIKLCNGDTPYVDAVLFAKEGECGSEIGCLEVSDEFVGEYEFEVEETLYGIHVEFHLTAIVAPK